MSWAEDRIALAMDAKRMGTEEERARIVEALAEIHVVRTMLVEDHPYCMGCKAFVDANGDCPTMRIAKGT